MLAFLADNWAAIAQGLLMVLGGASIIAKVTPTQSDDAIIDKILGIVHTLGLTKKE